MTPTYGSDQESASRALAALLKQPESALPATRDGQLLLMRSRDAALDALVERVRLLGVDQGDVDVLLKRRQRVDLEQFSRPRGALTWLAATLTAAPRLPSDLRGSPADTLTAVSEWPSVEAARTAGTFLLAATHWLRSDKLIPWDDMSTGWALLDDIAICTEALAALDGRIGQIIETTAGVPYDRTTAQSARMGCALIQRLASWHGDRHDDIDNARTPHLAVPRGGRVITVDTAASLITAQRRLSAYLTIRFDRSQPGEARIERSTALASVQTQLLLAQKITATLEANGPRWEPFAAIAGEQAKRLETTRDLLQGVRARTAYGHKTLTTVNPVLLQSRELARSIHMVDRVTGELDEDRVLNLLAFSHNVHKHLAERIRQELARPQGNLTVVKLPGQHPDTVRTNDIRRSTLGKALIAMRDAEPPRPPSRTHSRTHRETLRMLLSVSPPRAAIPPSPYGFRGPSL